MPEDKNKKKRKPRKKVPLFATMTLLEVCELLEKVPTAEVVVSRNFVLKIKENKIRNQAKQELNL